MGTQNWTQLNGCDPVIFHFFFHADVPGLPFFPYYKFSIYCRRRGAEIIRFQPSVSARIHACSCAAVTNVNPVPYKGEQV